MGQTENEEFKAAVDHLVREIIATMAKLPQTGNSRIRVVKTALFHVAASFITATTEGKLERDKALDAWGIHFRKFTNDQKKVPFPKRNLDS